MNNAIYRIFDKVIKLDLGYFKIPGPKVGSFRSDFGLEATLTVKPQTPNAVLNLYFLYMHIYGPRALPSLQYDTSYKR